MGLLNWNAACAELQSPNVIPCFYFSVPSCMCLNSVEALKLPKVITSRLIVLASGFLLYFHGLAHRFSSPAKGFFLNVACSNPDLVHISYDLRAVHS